MATDTSSHRRRLSAAMRQGEQVTPLELFFDLVFVLAMLAFLPIVYETCSYGESRARIRREELAPEATPRPA